MRMDLGIIPGPPVISMNQTLPIDPAPAEQEEHWVNVGHYPNLKQAYDHGLVVLAMGEACRVAEAEIPGEYDLQAELLPAAKVADELDTYRKESVSVPPRQLSQTDWARYPAGWWLSAVWVLLLTAVFLRQGQDPYLVERGASSSVGLMHGGEWWRPFTGLFFHADLSHLTGNIAGGVVFGSLVSKMIGPVKAWALILACGTVGNSITSWLTYPGAFVSIGASTAVFAALGILSGLGVAETLREKASLPWARISAPFLAGLVLLGWMGGGGNPNTDVLGHVFGFGSGFVTGVATGVLVSKTDARNAS